MAKAKAAKAAKAAKVVKPKPLTLEERVVELEGDLVRIVNSIGSILGEPFKSQGLEIVTRHQGRA